MATYHLERRVPRKGERFLDPVALRNGRGAVPTHVCSGGVVDPLYVFDYCDDDQEFDVIVGEAA